MGGGPEFRSRRRRRTWSCPFSSFPPHLICLSALLVWSGLVWPGNPPPPLFGRLCLLPLQPFCTLPTSPPSLLLPLPPPPPPTGPPPLSSSPLGRALSLPRPHTITCPQCCRPPDRGDLLSAPPLLPDSCVFSLFYLFICSRSCSACRFSLLS